MVNDNIEKFKKEIQKEDLVPCGWKVIKAEQLSKMELSEPEFLVEGLIPKEGITILAGNPASGKSWLLLEIAKCISSNQFLFDKFGTKEARVLYVDEEVNLGETKRRWDKLNPPYMTLTDFMNLQGFQIDDKEQRKGLLDLCVWRDYGMVIFDSLRDINSLNENDSLGAKILMDYFKEFTKRGITILISHHNRKESFLNPKEPSQVLRGSTAILANLDSLLAVENVRKTEQTIELIITQSKLKQGKSMSPFKLNLIEEDGKMKFEYGGEIEDEVRKLEKTKEAIIELLKHGERYTGEIVHTLIPLYFKERTIKRAITELKEAHTIKPRKEGQRTYYSL